MTARELTTAFYEEFDLLKKQGLIVAGIFGIPQLSKGTDLQIGISQGAEDYDEVHPETHRISVLHPFVFDGRKLPDRFMGFKIFKVYIEKSIPAEIDEIVLNPAGFKTAWTPDQFRNYAHRNASRIRKKLNDPNMTEDDILDAISLGNFAKYCDEYEEERLKRLIGE